MALILGLGAVCVDQIVTIPRMPAWDSLEYISSYTHQQGGIVATAMVAAAKLGVPSEFIGGIGDDEAGQYVLQCFKDAGIAMDRIVTFPGATTTFSCVLVHNTSGKRTILNYRGVQQQSDLTIPDIDLAGVRFLHLDGYWLKTALKTAKNAQKTGITVTCDPASRLLDSPQMPELLRYVDYFMPGYMLAQQLSSEVDPFQAASKLLAYGGKAVIITNGEEGCFVATPEERYHIPAFEVPVVDTTGAGDTFHGAFVAGLCKGYPLRQALQFASAVAALKCTKLGGQAGIPTFAEVQQFLAQQ